MNTPNIQHEKIFASLHKAAKRIYANSFTVNFYIDGVLEIFGCFDDWRNYLNDSDEPIITIRFSEVSYISLPAYIFENPVFRLATTSEIAQVRKLVDIDSAEYVYCIEAETLASSERLPFFLVAEDISFQIGKYKNMYA